MIARVLFITIFVLALAQAAPPVKPPPNAKSPAPCVDVQSISYSTETRQCSMDVKAGKNDAFTSISGPTLQALVKQTQCDFIPFLIGTTQCSEIMKAMPI
jgi:hypothetical protein